MDTKQIEYILKIAEENNITKAAGKLFITQSALNQQLIKLEKELGTPLPPFPHQLAPDRSRRNLCKKRQADAANQERHLSDDPRSD